LLEKFNCVAAVFSASNDYVHFGSLGDVEV
jgi:hypothetical protein